MELGGLSAGERVGGREREAQSHKCWGPDATYGLVLSVVETTLEGS